MLDVKAAKVAEADRCRYSRPFTEDFTGCPTYQGVTFIAFDSMGQRGGTWLTCRHLTSANHPSQSGRFYPKCALGSEADRLRWLARVSQARVEVIRALQSEFDQFVEPLRNQLINAKREALHEPTSLEARDSLDRVVVAYQKHVRQFLGARRDRLEAVGFQSDQMIGLLESTMKAWLKKASIAPPAVAESDSGLVDPYIQAFLVPTGQTPWRAEGARRECVYEDDKLRISKLLQTPGLQLDGTVDASNVEAFSEVLLAQVGQTAIWRLDLSGLLFCDLGGMRAIVTVAGRLREGQRLVLVGVPQQLRRTMVLAGWGQHHALEFDDAKGQA